MLTMHLLYHLTKRALGCLDGYAPSYSGPQPDALLLSYRHMDPHVGAAPTPETWKDPILLLYECELMEGYTGNAPASPPWQGGIITNIRIPQYSNLKTSLPVGPNSRMGSLALCVTSNFWDGRADAKPRFPGAHAQTVSRSCRGVGRKLLWFGNENYLWVYN